MGVHPLKPARSLAWYALFAVIPVVMYWAGKHSTLTERDSLKAMVQALRTSGAGCAVEDDGRKVVCWQEAGILRAMPLKSNDLIVSRDCLPKRLKAKACAR